MATIITKYNKNRGDLYSANADILECHSIERAFLSKRFKKVVSKRGFKQREVCYNYVIMILISESEG